MANFTSEDSLNHFIDILSQSEWIKEQRYT